MSHRGNEESCHIPGPTVRQRAAWVSPRVVVSELKHARSGVDFGPDGSVPTYGPYGS
jgi:hypothetical protein